MNPEYFHSRLESLLERSFELNSSDLNISGSHSLLMFAFFLAQSYSNKINGLPHLAVVPSYADALKLQQLLLFFNPHKTSTVLSSFDVSPYSGLSPSQRHAADRLRFLCRAQHARSGEIFISSVEALLQKTIPFHSLKSFTYRFSPGDEIPSDFSSLLVRLGYTPSPYVEDCGQFAIRGGIIDVFSPAENYPVRVELFGNQIESIRSFNSNDQKSLDTLNSLSICPAHEALYFDEHHEDLLRQFKDSLKSRNIHSSESEETLRSLILKHSFSRIEFLLPYFYKKLESPLEHFNSSLNVWFIDSVGVIQAADAHFAEIKASFMSAQDQVICPNVDLFFSPFEQLLFPPDSKKIFFNTLSDIQNDNSLNYKTHSVQEFSNLCLSHQSNTPVWAASAKQKLNNWIEDGYKIFLSCRNQSQQDRVHHLISGLGYTTENALSSDYLWNQWIQDSPQTIHIIPRFLSESLRLDEEKIIFLRDEDLFGKKVRSKSSSAYEDFQRQAKRLSFGDLKPNDFIVHLKHGVGQYDGLKSMVINGYESEYIQIAYKDNDKLYLPVYNIGQVHKYAGAAAHITLDRLGGAAWEKSKIKVKNSLKDLASELLELYARRAQLTRPPFIINESDALLFAHSFSYEETDDQLSAINDIKKDFISDKPMDRLICGDVGFGKTEVAMRAAFFAISSKKQVAVLAPTTVLTFQHSETFKNRFKEWPINIQVINRFIPNKEIKKVLSDLKEGRVDLVIGTHRLLSKDVDIKNLGLLIIDEEQKFGVTHKEKIKKLKTMVDTLSLSATPIPRSLNMSLMGIRDLSLINTPPMDRLPTRTFVTQFDEEIIRKSITNEIHRGGQVYFIHNRIQSIYSIAEELKQIVPTARIRVGHGQMHEHELEETMLAFFNHEIDVLVCTTIVESGMDVPRANTMFIDEAHMFGLSQLYQLRGRVGRSKERAYCYLILPRNKKLDETQQERLKIIQENTALGSGIKIAQYDLELRGSGNILGDDQSGHINAVGYELYMDLLNDALANAKGDPHDDYELEPEINLRIPALIPSNYISDIRIRLSYYKAMAEIQSQDDLDQIENDLRDQFGKIPDHTINLMGLMLIRKACKELGVRDVSAGAKNISLIFTEKTRLKPEVAIQLAMKENKKYSITPDNRLNIRLNNITWVAVYEEISYLLKLVN